MCWHGLRRLFLSLCLFIGWGASAHADKSTTPPLTQATFKAWIDSNEAYQNLMSGPRTPESVLAKLLADGALKAFDTGGAQIYVQGSTAKEQLFWVFFQVVNDGRLMKQHDIGIQLYSHYESLRNFGQVKTQEDLFKLEKAQALVYAAIASGHNAVEASRIADTVRIPYRRNGRVAELGGRELLTQLQRWHIPYIQSGSDFTPTWRFWNVYNFDKLPKVPEGEGIVNISDPLTPMMAQVMTLAEGSESQRQLVDFKDKITELIDWSKAFGTRSPSLPHEQRQALVDAVIDSRLLGPDRLKASIAKDSRLTNLSLSGPQLKSLAEAALDGTRRATFELIPKGNAEFAKDELSEVLQNVQVTVGTEVEERIYLTPHSSQMIEIMKFSILNGRSAMPPPFDSYEYIDDLAPYFESVIKAEQSNIPAIAQHLESLKRRAESFLKRELTADEVKAIADGQAYLFTRRIFSNKNESLQVIQSTPKGRRNIQLEDQLRAMGLLPPADFKGFWDDDVWRMWGLSQAEGPIHEKDNMLRRLKRAASNYQNFTEDRLAHGIYHRTNIFTTEDEATAEFDIPTLKRAIRILVHRSPESVEAFQQDLQNAKLMRDKTNGGKIEISTKAAEDIYRQSMQAMSALLPRVNCELMMKGLKR